MNFDEQMKRNKERLVSKRMNSKEIIKIFETQNEIRVECPYHLPFIKAAKTLNGKWNSVLRFWYFSKSSETEVRALVNRTFNGDIPYLGDQCGRAACECGSENILLYDRFYLCEECTVDKLLKQNIGNS